MMLDAARDPAYHRYLMFGGLDQRRAARLGRPLGAHEMLASLPIPQVQIIRRIERAISARAGEVIVVRSARQTGKNECEAMLEARFLSLWGSIPGSTWVRTAPTFRPQIATSILRLDRTLKRDPLTNGAVRPRLGYIREHVNAQVHFLSGGATANVLGATASCALSVDEAHKIDRGKFEEELSPFTAFTNAPVILWGVAAAGMDLLYEYREAAHGTDRVLEFPASVWAEHWPAYAAHYQEKRRKLGADHPVVRTQYDLVDVAAVGAYLSDAQRASLFEGDHPRLEAPRDGAGLRYVMVVDIGGESEMDAESRDLRVEEPARDYTIAWIVELDSHAPQCGEYPLARIVAGRWRVGAAHEKERAELEAYARHWRIAGGVVDARGVGEAVASALHRRSPSIVSYKASAQDVSSDCYDLLARINAGAVRFWRADPAADQLLREIQSETRHCRYEIHQHDLMRLVKPTGAGSFGLHIDGVKALTYLHRAILTPHAGLLAFTRGRAEAARASREGTTDATS